MCLSNPTKIFSSPFPATLNPGIGKHEIIATKHPKKFPKAKQKHASIRLNAIPIPGAHPPINKNPSIEG